MHDLAVSFASFQVIKKFYEVWSFIAFVGHSLASIPNHLKGHESPCPLPSVPNTRTFDCFILFRKHCVTQYAVDLKPLFSLCDCKELMRFTLIYKIIQTHRPMATPLRPWLACWLVSLASTPCSVHDAAPFPVDWLSWEIWLYLFSLDSWSGHIVRLTGSPKRLHFRKVRREQ